MFTAQAIVCDSVLFTVYIQSMVGLSSDIELDTMDCCKDVTKWTWFNQYCLAARMAKALQNRTPIPAK